MDRYEELLSEYLEGGLDEAGRAELAALLEHHPERLRELVDLVREHRILSVDLGEPLGPEFTRSIRADLDRDKTRFVRAVMTELRGPGTLPGQSSQGRRRIPGARPKGPSTWLPWAFVAGAAAVILGVLFFFSGGGPEGPPLPHARAEKPLPAPAPPEKPPDPRAAPPAVELPRPPKPALPAPPPEEKPPPKDSVPKAPPPNPPAPPAPAPEPGVPPGPPETKPPEKSTVVQVATLERLEGAVWVGPAPAQAGQSLLSGFELKVPEDRSGATLRYPDGTRLDVKGGSRLLDLPGGPGRRVQVEGVVLGLIAPQPKDRPMIFATAQGEAKVLGTTLRLWVDPDPKKGTRLDVDEGKVEFRNLAGKSVLVEGGHYAVAAQGVTLQTRPARVVAGLAALYTFKEGRGGIIHDVSRSGIPIDLKIDDEKAVRWSSKGLLLAAPTIAASMGPATRIIQACKESQEVTLEAWIRPTTVKPDAKDGRILTLSADPTNQDFMLGQEGLEGPPRSFFARLRTTETDAVGKPILASREGRAELRLTHLVYTRSSKGVAVLYVDGIEDQRSTSGGTLQAWDEGYRFALGNEMTNNRPWLGEYHLAAIYSRALSADDVRQNHRAGTE